MFLDGYTERKHSPPVKIEGTPVDLKETKAPFRERFRRFARHAFPLCRKKAFASNGIRGKRLFSTVLIVTRDGSTFVIRVCAITIHQVGGDTF
jgi:hypothetical protein